MKYPVNDSRNDPEDKAEPKAPSKAEEKKEKTKLYPKGAVQAAKIMNGGK